MPPTQWVKLLQKRMLWSSDSTSRNMLDPVVVKPDTVSKKASTKDGVAPLMINGNAPKADIRTHASPTIIKPSLSCITELDGFLILRSSPASIRRQAVIKNAGHEDSPYIRDTDIGSKRRRLSTFKTLPSVESIIL